jgi:hypothetical protein
MNLAIRYYRRLIAGDFSQGQAFWAILVPALLLIKTTAALLALSNAIQNPVISTRLWLPILIVTLLLFVPVLFFGCFRAIFIAQQKFKGGYQSILLFVATLGLVYWTSMSLYQNLPLFKTMAQIALTQDDMTLTLRESNNSSILYLDGQLEYGATQQVAHWLREHPQVKSVDLNLDGGHLHEARALARLIIRNHLNTQVTGRCSASCMLAMVAGVQRIADQQAVLQFHRTQDYDNGYRNEWIMERERQTDRAYYQRRGVSAGYVHPIYYVQPDNAYLQPSLETLLGVGVITGIADLQGSSGSS